MELQFKSNQIQILIDCIAQEYNTEEILSLARNIDVRETDFYNQNMTMQQLADVFVSRVKQLSKLELLVDIINSDERLGRKDIIEKLGIESEEICVKNMESNKLRDITILHISDIHLGTKDEARKYLMQLEIDLKKAIRIKEVDFLVVSGDITNEATSEQYDAAQILIDGIASKFQVNMEKIIIVPGNHDLNWEESKKAISYTSDGTIKYDEDIYKQRFFNYSEFYKQVTGKDYPIEYAEQGIVYEYDDEKIVFLGLNSAWEIDHINKERSSININSCIRPMEMMVDEKYDDFLKIVVCHHPVTGNGSMNNEFLQILIRNEFKVCMHGHIHEAKYDFEAYGSDKDIAIVGAGTFGAPDKEHVVGIPLQYNFITITSENKSLRVDTRRKEKSDGAWEADARWGNKDNPVPFYTIDLN